MTLSIIIPVFNEEKTIEKLLNKIIKVDLGKWCKQIIVIDDCSCDETVKILSKFKNIRASFRGEKLKILRHEKNKGKGAAIQTGLRYVKGDAVIIQDADLEYDPKDLPKLLKELDKGETDIVFGSRNLNLKQHFIYTWGINLSTFLVNLLYGSNIKDLYTCYKLYKIDALKLVSSKSHGFEWDIDIVTKLLKRGAKVEDIPISYKPRKFSEGKKIKPWDGVVGIWVILKNKFF